MHLPPIFPDRPVCAVLALAALLVQPSCKKETAAPAEAAPDVSAQLKTIAPGATVRVVWLEDKPGQPPDPLANGANLTLAGHDSDKGPRRLPLAPVVKNPARPLFTPDGTAVVFSDKQVTEKSGMRNFEPKMYRIPWDGASPRTPELIGDGFAVALWRDPGTKQDWVYALTTLTATNRASLSGQKLFRFPLASPAQREPVWDSTPIGVDSFSLSRDGKFAAALFPWPDAGVADLTAKTWRKLGSGCWPAMAPDNSYMSWVFDGSHRRVRLFDAAGVSQPVISFQEVEGFAAGVIYHPRWTNHPQFAVVTGPYRQPGKNEEPELKGAARLAWGAATAEVNLVHLAADLQGVDGFVRLTSNKAGDYYPDAWISTGGSTVLEGFAQSPPPPPPPDPETEIVWPRAQKGLGYAWLNATSTNLLPGQSVPCQMAARGVARPGVFSDMLVDGGWWESVDDFGRRIGVDCAKSNEFSVELLMTEERRTPDLLSARILAYELEDGTPVFTLHRVDEQLVCRVLLGGGEGQAPKEYQSAMTFPISAVTPCHLVIVIKDGKISWRIDSTMQDFPALLGPATFAAWKAGRIVAGDKAGVNGDWSVRIQNLAVWSRALDDGESAEESVHAYQRPVLGDRVRPATARVKAKLVQASPASAGDLDTYHRMLVDSIYDVEQAISGKLKFSRIAVLHWAILDDTFYPARPQKIGEIVELSLEPAGPHAELASELTQISDEADSLPLYYDVSTPVIPPPPAK